MMATKSEKHADLLPTHYEIHGKQQMSWSRLLREIRFLAIMFALLGGFFWFDYTRSFNDAALPNRRQDYDHNHDLAVTPRHKVALEAHIMYVTQ